MVLYLYTRYSDSVHIYPLYIVVSYIDIRRYIGLYFAYISILARYIYMYMYPFIMYFYAKTIYK